MSLVWGVSPTDTNPNIISQVIHRQLIDITNSSLSNNEQVRLAHFWHQDPLNFCHNFRDYLAAFDLKLSTAVSEGATAEASCGIYFC